MLNLHANVQVREWWPKIVVLSLVLTYQGRIWTKMWILVDTSELKLLPSNSRLVKGLWTEILRPILHFSKQCTVNPRPHQETSNSQMHSQNYHAQWQITWLCNSKGLMLKLTTKWSNTPGPWQPSTKQQLWRPSNPAQSSVVETAAHWQAPLELPPQQEESQAVLVDSVLFLWL